MKLLPPESTSPPSQAGKRKDPDAQALDFARRAASLKALERVCCVIGFGSLFSGVALMVLLNVLVGIPPNSWECAIIIPVALSGLIGGFVVSTKRSAMMRRARDTRDRRKVGILLDVYIEFYNISSYSRTDLSRPSRWRAKVIEFANVLSVLLPQIEEDDAKFLSPKQRGVLRNLLQHTDSALVAAALSALKKIGNSADLPIIEELAQGKWKAAQDLQLRQAAEETSVGIRERLSQQNNTATLLRATSVPEAASDELLRPMTSQFSKTEVQQLLRARDKETP